MKSYPAFLMEMFLHGGKKEINVSAGQKETKGEHRSGVMACKIKPRHMHYTLIQFWAIITGPSNNEAFCFNVADGPFVLSCAQLILSYSWRKSRKSRKTMHQNSLKSRKT